MGKAVAEVKNTAVAGYNYGDDAHAGFEGTTGADLSIPFFNVLQSNSKQVEEGVPEGAKAGQLFNTVTGELIDGTVGFPFLPVHKDRAYVEWIPRTKGGGFVGLYDVNSEEVADAIKRNGGKKFGKLTIGENELIDTKYVYGLVLDTDLVTSVGFGVLAFTSTKMKIHDKWLTSMYTLKGRPPMFANRAIIRTQKEKNEKGSFFNLLITPARETWITSLINPATEGDLLREAKEFREMVLSGMARAAFETQGATGDQGGDDTGKAPF